MTAMTRLTNGQRFWLATAVTLATAGMIGGFAFSFGNLSSAAQGAGWKHPVLLPLEIDTEIPVYVIIDHLLVMLGVPARLTRAIQWAFAVLTIVFNGAFTPDAKLLWRVAAGAVAAVWVLGIEVLRLIWKALRDGAPAKRERIPAGRWAAAPWPTLKLWRRMTLLGVTSWPLMLALEDARLRAADLIAAARESDPALAVPGSLRRALRSGRLPAPVRDAACADVEAGTFTADTAVARWVFPELGIREAAGAALKGARSAAAAVVSASPEATPAPAQEAPPEGAPEAPPEVPAKAASRAAPDYSRKLPSGKARGMSPEELLPYARARIEAAGKESKNDLKGWLTIGDAKVAALWNLLHEDTAKAPFPIHAVN